MAVCSEFINPLDLECLFVNYFAGSMVLFMFIGLFITLWIGARLKFTPISIFASWLVFGLMFYVSAPAIGFILAFVAALMMAITIAKITGK